MGRNTEKFVKIVNESCEDFRKARNIVDIFVADDKKSAYIEFLSYILSGRFTYYDIGSADIETIRPNNSRSFRYIEFLSSPDDIIREVNLFCRLAQEADRDEYYIPKP